jgi:hypothetical protein
MKKRITLFALILISFATISFINHDKQTDKFPQIQKYLESIKEMEMKGEKPMKISQKLNAKTFTYITNWYDVVSKDYYENISWKYFDYVDYTKVDDKYTKCDFKFSSNMKLTTNDSTEKTDYFTCYIFTKDKKKVEKIMEEFENKNLINFH